jgi:GH35 family endo-1,4-beta-xylanase
MYRRQFLEAAAALGMTGGAERLRLRAFAPSGAPAGRELLDSLLLLDANGRPFELLPQPASDGALEIGLPDGRFEIMMTLPVRNFGQVYLFADNEGTLYSSSAAQAGLLLNYEFARSRVAFVRRYLGAGSQEGILFGAEVKRRLERGEALLRQATAEPEIQEKARLSNESLEETMWAGEMAALERARQRIARRGSRVGFLFGCNAFRFLESENLARRFTELLNFGTLPFYRKSTEPTESTLRFSRVDSLLEKMAGSSLLVKGHPLIWFHEAGIPEHLKHKSYADLRASCRGYILRCVGRYRTRIHAWDIINEAHDWANDLNLSADQMIDMTRLGALAAREADPTAFRIVNSCCLGAEYVARRRSYSGPLGRRARSTYDYLEALEASQVPYEAVGLKAYYDELNRDMLEIERLLRRFFRFGKPIHINEQGIPSSNERVPDGEVPDPTPNVWHGTAWNEQIQADWVEQFYTLCCSQPEIEAVSWWDFTDRPFVPHGGLLRTDESPKPAYERLARLLASWRERS